MRKETKNGVTYTFETDDLTGEAIDVEVQPGMQDVYDIIAEADSMKMSKAYALDIIGSGSKNTFRL